MSCFPMKRYPIYSLGTHFCTWSKAMAEQLRITRVTMAQMLREERPGADR